MKLLLWDIDGTLICNGQAGERAFDRVFDLLFNRKVSIRSVDYRGRTDRMIARMMLEYCGIPLTEKNLHDVLDGYLRLLAEELPKGEGGPHPGILEILNEARRRPDIAQGLLTGNMIRGAELKLGHYDVWNYFEFGAFADDSPIRDELGPHAIKRAKEFHEVDFPSEKIFVIGDTPHDVACGKAIGAKTIAVATGAYALEQLEACEPTRAFRDLSNPREFFQVVDGDSS